jgi:threonine dehydratase
MDATTSRVTALKDVIRPTTVIESPRLSKRLGVEVTFATETFQYTGSFKFRAAYNLASAVAEQEIITGRRWHMPARCWANSARS